MSANPSVSPSSDDWSEIWLMPPAASSTPVAAVVAQTAFGMRRLAASMTAALHMPAQSTVSTAASEFGSNGPPEDVGDLGGEHSHRRQGEDGDQRRQQAVLEQVLPSFPAPHPIDELREKQHSSLLRSPTTTTGVC